MTELNGALDGLGLPAIVRFLAGLRVTGWLRVVHEDWHGELFLEAGRVVAASFGNRTGLAAIEALIQALPEGQFTFTTTSATSGPEQRNIDLSADELLARLDEWAEAGQSAPGLPPLSAVPVVVPQEDGGEADGGSGTNVHLDRGTLQTLLAVDGRRSVREIVTARGTFEALWQLQNLARLGVIDLRVPAGPAAPRPATPASAAPSGAAAPGGTASPAGVAAPAAAAAGAAAAASALAPDFRAASSPAAASAPSAPAVAAPLDAIGHAPGASLEAPVAQATSAPVARPEVQPARPSSPFDADAARPSGPSMQPAEARPATTPGQAAEPSPAPAARVETPEPRLAAPIESPMARATAGAPIESPTLRAVPSPAEAAPLTSASASPTAWPGTRAASAPPSQRERELLEAPVVHCPKLGLESDPSQADDLPTRQHRCYAFGDPLTLPIEQQRELCLTHHFPSCPRLEAAGTPPAAGRTPVAAEARAAEASGMAEPAAARPRPWAGLLASARQLEVPAGLNTRVLTIGGVALLVAVIGLLLVPRFLESGDEAVAIPTVNATPRPGAQPGAPQQPGQSQPAASAQQAQSQPAGATPQSQAAGGAPQPAGQQPTAAQPASAQPPSAANPAGQAGAQAGANTNPGVNPPAAQPGGASANPAAGGANPAASNANPNPNPAANSPGAQPAANANPSAAQPGANANANPSAAQAGAAGGQPGAAQPAAGQPGAAQPGGANAAAGQQSPNGPRVLLDERFADNTQRWIDVPGGPATLTNGTYQLTAKQNGQFMAIGVPVVDVLRDVVVGASFKKLSGPPGGGFGLIVRDQGPDARDGASQGGRYYVLEVGDKGEVGIWRRETDHWVDLLPWQHADAVHPGNDTNEMVVRAIGDQLSLQVNGAQVGSSVDNALPAGRIGLFVGGDQNTIAVDHFWVQAP